MTDDIDETALNVLLAEGMDPATAYAAAQCDQPSPRPSVNRWAVSIGTLIGALIVLGWMLL